MLASDEDGTSMGWWWTMTSGAADAPRDPRVVGPHTWTAELLVDEALARRLLRQFRELDLRSLRLLATGWDRRRGAGSWAAAATFASRTWVESAWVGWSRGPACDVEVNW